MRSSLVQILKQKRILGTLQLNPNHAGGAKWPTANLNDYFSATECPIDLKPSCIFKFVRCLEVCQKMDEFGPLRDPGGPFIGKGPPKSASQGPLKGPFGGP